MEANNIILVILGNKQVLDILRFVLQREGYRFIAVTKGTAGIEKAMKEDVGAVIVDTALEDMSGFEVCRSLRASCCDSPIIFLAAQGDEGQQEVAGMPDVFILMKPFPMQDLVACLAAHMQPSSSPIISPVRVPNQTLNGLSFAEENLQVFRDGKEIQLTQTEYDLLLFLANHPGEVFSRETLMKEIWGYDYVGASIRAVDVAIRRLRERIEDDPSFPTLILTRRGAGYYFGGW